MHSNNSNKAKPKVVLAHAAIAYRKTNFLISNIPWFKKMHPLLKSLQLAARILFKNKFSSRDIICSYIKSSCNNIVTQFSNWITERSPTRETNKKNYAFSLPVFLSIQARKCNKLLLIKILVSLILIVSWESFI